MKNKKLKQIPKFANEDEERDFWATADTTEYFDDSKGVTLPNGFPNIKLSKRTVTLRMPESLWADLKTLADLKDVPYQSLMKVWLMEKVMEEKLKLKKLAKQV